GAAGTAPLVSGTAVFPLPAGESPPPQQHNSLDLRAFLDLDPGETWPSVRSPGQLPDTNRDALGARRSPSAAGGAGAESLPAEPVSANVDTHHRGRWTELLHSLLVAVSISVVWSYWQRPPRRMWPRGWWTRQSRSDNSR